MCKPLTNDCDDERGKGAEHPDLILSGQEEHPLWVPILDLFIEDDPA